MVIRWLQGFWRQPSPAYRNFQMVFTILTLNFVLPALSYVVAPAIVGEQFSQVNALLGGDPYLFPEAESRLWRYLGAANVMSLGLMCFLLQLNLRRFQAVLWPLVFLKGYNAFLFLGGFVGTPQYPGFLAVAVLDLATAGLFLLFGLSALRQIRGVSDEDLVPRPRS